MSARFYYRAGQGQRAEGQRTVTQGTGGGICAVIGDVQPEIAVALHDADSSAEQSARYALTPAFGTANPHSGRCLYSLPSKIRYVRERRNPTPVTLASDAALNSAIVDDSISV